MTRSRHLCDHPHAFLLDFFGRLTGALVYIKVAATGPRGSDDLIVALANDTLRHAWGRRKDGTNGRCSSVAHYGRHRSACSALNRCARVLTGLVRNLVEPTLDLVVRALDALLTRNKLNVALATVVTGVKEPLVSNIT